MTTTADRVAAIRRRMARENLDRIVAIHDGTHFIETPNPVKVLTGFKSLGATAAIIECDGDLQLVVTPAWDVDRATEACRGVRVVGAADVVDGLSSVLGQGTRGAVGIAGLPFAPWRMTRRINRAVAYDPADQRRLA